MSAVDPILAEKLAVYIEQNEARQYDRKFAAQIVPKLLKKKCSTEAGRLAKSGTRPNDMMGY